MQTCQPLIKENLKTHDWRGERDRGERVLTRSPRHWPPRSTIWTPVTGYFIYGPWGDKMPLSSLRGHHLKKMDEPYSKGSFHTDKPTNHGQNVRQSPNKAQKGTSIRHWIISISFNKATFHFRMIFPKNRDIGSVAVREKIKQSWDLRWNREIWQVWKCPIKKNAKHKLRKIMKFLNRHHYEAG